MGGGGSLPVDVHHPKPVLVMRLRQQMLGRHWQEITTAAARPGAAKLAHYIAAAWPAGQLPPAEEYTPAPVAYLVVMWQHAQRAALAQLRAGLHWSAEETG